MGRGEGVDAEIEAISRTDISTGAAGAGDYWESQWEIEDDPRFISEEHEYDPRSDYEIRMDQLDDPLIELANNHLDWLAKTKEMPFERGSVLPARGGMPDECCALYCAGTYNQPVILVDLDKHRVDDWSQSEIERAICETVSHEARHALQDADGEPFDEEEAEAFHGSW